MTRMKNVISLALLISFLFTVNKYVVNAIPKEAEGGNIAPTIDLSVTPAKKLVDIVILTDYTGTKLSALNTQINALKAQFSAVNVDPVFHMINSVKKIGTQSDELYEFRRYGRFFYTVSSYKRYKDYGLEESYAPHTLEETVLWEETEGLLSQYSNLPVRNPKNVTFTKSSLIIDKGKENTTDRDRRYYDITIRCTNDVKTSGMVEEEIYYKNYITAREEVYGSIMSEHAVVDTLWTVYNKISDVSYDVYSLDFDKLNTLPLRSASDRHMIFLSDAVVKDYGKSFGNYFSFGELTDSVKNYIKNNSFAVYGVAPEKTRHATLLHDKISDIEQYGIFTLFHAENGDLLKFGNRIFGEQLDNGDIVYPELSSDDMSLVKEVFFDSYSVYLLMNDGTFKKAYQNEDFITVEGVTDIKGVYQYNSGGFFLVNTSGKVFRYYNNTVTQMSQGSIIIDRVITVGGNSIFLTASGVPYGIREYYDGSDWFYDTLTRFQIRYTVGEEEYSTNLGAIKDAKEYRTTGIYGGTVAGVVVQYTNDKIEQFLGFDSIRVDGSNNRRWYYPHIERTNEYQINETNIASLDTTYYGVVLHKKDGTTRFITADFEERTTYSDGVKITYMHPIYSNESKLIPLSNLKYVYGNFNGNNYYRDANNRVYNLISTRTEPLPVLGTGIVDMGTDIKKIVNSHLPRLMYILYDDGRLREIEYNSNGTLRSNKIIFTDIKNIYSVGNWQTYLLKFDGSVLGEGFTDNGQLGIIRNRPSRIAIRNVFNNVFTFDQTETYYSLLELFKEVSNSAFYPAGAYTTAFNDIYTNYSASSGSGNMYVLLGEDIKYESAYSDYESDPEHSRLWRISHDPYYFDNSMGLSQYHDPGGFAANPPVKLDKAGKYIINLKTRDNPKADNRFDSYRLWSLGDQNLTVYIHRKPIAQQRITVTNNGNGTFTIKAFDAGSYDPDHSVSRSDKGITAREWRWKEATSTNWTTGQMNKNDCLPDKSYITQLRVKDVEGVWSDYAGITIDRNNPPAALFNIDKRIISISEPLKVKDHSYTQSLSELTRWQWLVKKLNADGSVPSANVQNAQFAASNTGTGAMEGFDVNVRTNYSSNGIGKYRVYLRVKDSNGLWSNGGTDSITPADLAKYHSIDFEVDRPPAASFTVDSLLIRPADILKVKDTSTASGTSALVKWQWIVKKLNGDGSVPGTNVQNEVFDSRNSGTGSMAGYDINVLTDYSSLGTGVYRIYLRVMNGNGMWSDGGTEEAYNLGSCFERDITVDAPPSASFNILNNPLKLPELLKLRDTSYKTGVSDIDRWHWRVVKLNPDGSVSDTYLQDAAFGSSNNGTGILDGFDANVKTDFNTDGPGIYRIYLRVRNGSGMWSDGGTNSSPNINNFFHQDVAVEESLRIANFRVVKVRDRHLESFYLNTATGQYEDKPMYVNAMAIDNINFEGMVDGLTKGYMFEFEIDTVGFNDDTDTIMVTPGFYTCDSFGRDSEERDLYWENSRHEVLKAGQGGHSDWAYIILNKDDRIVTGENTAIWRGSYLIPGTAWAVPRDTSAGNAVESRLNRDIIVSFEIKGYKDGTARYHYNLQQWPTERTEEKTPYELGDVIRYSHQKCNLDDIDVIINRP